MKRALAVLFLLAAAQLQAAVYHGTVTHVTDGDTLWVRPAAGGAPVEIRLLDLDAPEGCQAFGAEATRALRQRLLHQRVRVRSTGTDDYQRQLARIEHRRTDIGAWLVQNGYAWSTRFRGRPGAYADLQDRARAQRRGLWAQPGAMEPRTFRRRFGSCHEAR